MFIKQNRKVAYEEGRAYLVPGIKKATNVTSPTNLMFRFVLLFTVDS